MRFLLPVMAVAVLLLAGVAHAASPSDWSVYLHDNSRDNASQDGQTFASTSLHLTETWSFNAGAQVVASPVLANGYAYVPSWDGNLYAVDLSTHQLVWKRFLGTQKIWWGPAGISSPPAFAADIGPNGAILAGGGGQEQTTNKHLYFYALDAETGDMLWRANVGGALKDSIFDSPLYLDGHVYIGNAASGAGATGNLPPRPGILFELDGQTGKLLNTRSMATPKGYTGGAVWGSVSADPAGKRIFVPTGDGLNASKQHLTEGFVAVDPSTLRVMDHWQVPPKSQSPDDDFGATTTVFSDGSRTLVGSPIKSGMYYALDATNLKKGPVWKRRVANSGSLPVDQNDDTSASAFATGPEYPGGRTLYVAGPNARIHGSDADGGLYALNPANGHVIWSVPLSGTVRGAVTVYDDTVIVASFNDNGGEIDVRSASDGHLLASFPLAGDPLAAPVVLSGTIYIGTADGIFHAIRMSTS